jgi:hypothetical protein
MNSRWWLEYTKAATAFHYAVHVNALLLPGILHGIVHSENLSFKSPWNWMSILTVTNSDAQAQRGSEHQTEGGLAHSFYYTFFASAKTSTWTPKFLTVALGKCRLTRPVRRGGRKPKSEPFSARPDDVQSSHNVRQQSPVTAKTLETSCIGSDKLHRTVLPVRSYSARIHALTRRFLQRQMYM